jgi:hypothetical protein
MTGPFVPVGILNPIRAVVGIPIIDSTFSSNALGSRVEPVFAALARAGGDRFRGIRHIGCQLLPGPERKDDRRILGGIMHVQRVGCRWKDCRMNMGPPIRAKNVWQEFSS